MRFKHYVWRFGSSEAASDGDINQKAKSRRSADRACRVSG